MEPDGLRFGGGAGSTLLHPVAAIMLLLAALLILSLPRQRAIVPYLLMLFLEPMGQVIVAGGIHFPLPRVVFLLGLLKFAISKPPRNTGRLPGGFGPMDKAVVGLAVSFALAFMLLYQDSGAVINRLGYLVDTLGAYFLLRSLIREEEDIRRVIKVFAVIAIISSIGMLNEQRTGQNVFGMFGGHRGDGLPLSVCAVRDGKIRAQGPFGVYLEAGVFGATLFPLFLWLWQDRGSRKIAAAGMVASAIMAWACSSSTPMMAYAGIIVALAFWPLRERMRTIRWGLLLTLVSLHLVMKAPVWALIARVDLTGSSTSYQRYELIDAAIRHFTDWMLVGAKDYNTWGWSLWDLADQYVLFALQGGLATLVFFILLIKRSFGRIGDARKLVRGDTQWEWRLWCLGAALFGYVMAWFGTASDSQMQVSWLALFAIIAAATYNVATAVQERAVEPEVEYYEPPMLTNYFENLEQPGGAAF
jgi:hypothetical protein